MDNRRYAQLLDAETSSYGLWNVPRSRFGIGENSPESACNAKGFYLIEFNEPKDLPSTQRKGGQHIEFKDNKFIVTYDIIDIPQEELDRIHQEKINGEALKYLEETDWMVTRFAETGTAIDPEVLKKREEARASIIKL